MLHYVYDQTGRLQCGTACTAVFIAKIRQEYSLDKEKLTVLFETVKE